MEKTANKSFITANSTDLRLEIKTLESDLQEFESVLRSHHILLKTCDRLNTLKLADQPGDLELLIGYYQAHRDRYIWVMEENGIPYKQKAKVIILPKSYIPENDQGKNFIEKKLIGFFKDLFRLTGLQQILMTQKIILNEVFDLDYGNDRSLIKVLKKDLKLKQSKLQSFSYPHYQEGKRYDLNYYGRPYIFLREKFIHGTEGKLRRLPLVTQFLR